MIGADDNNSNEKFNDQGSVEDEGVKYEEGNNNNSNNMEGTSSKFLRVL